MIKKKRRPSSSSESSKKRARPCQGMRNKNRLVGSIVAGIVGLCCALVLVGRETPVSLLSGVPGDTRVVAASITGTLFGRDLQLAGASRKRNVAYGLPVRFKAGMMLDDEDEPADDEESADKDSEEPAEEDGGESGDEYAKFVWRKERLEKDWGVNTDTWLDPGLLGNIDYKDGPFTAGIKRENIDMYTCMKCPLLATAAIHLSPCPVTSPRYTCVLSYSDMLTSEYLGIPSRIRHNERKIERVGEGGADARMMIVQATALQMRTLQTLQRNLSPTTGPS